MLRRLQIDIKIAVADGDQTGEPYGRHTSRYVTDDESGARVKKVTDDESGARVKKEVPFRIRRWWWKDANGQIMLDVRYGNCCIELKVGKTAIEVCEMGNLVPNLKLLAEAVQACELERQASAPQLERPLVMTANLRWLSCREFCDDIGIVPDRVA